MTPSLARLLLLVGRREVVHVPQRQPSTSGSYRSAPLWVLSIALLTSALDLLAVLQRYPLLSTLAFATCAVAGMALALCWLRQPRAAWLAAAFLAFAASMVLRVGGNAEAPALAILGIVALGAGGGFGVPGRTFEDELDAPVATPSAMVAGPVPQDGGGTP